MAGMSMNQIIAAQGSRRASRPRPLPGRVENPFQPRARAANPSRAPQPASKRASNPCSSCTKQSNPVVGGRWGGGWGGWGGWGPGWPGMWGWGYPFGRFVQPIVVSTAPVPVTTTRLVRPHPSTVLATAAQYAYPPYYGGWGGYGGYGWGGGYYPYARYGVAAVA